MNETSATSTPGADLLPDGIGALTAVHFVVIALIAALAVAVIVAGIRRSRARKAALHEVDRHAAEAGVPPAEEEAEAENAASAPPAEPSVRDEPVAAAAPMAAAPAIEDAVVPVPAATGGDTGADGPVTQLKGLGPKVAARLAELGVTRVGQLAALSDGEAAALDAQLGAFAGRMARDRWIEQARLLAAGDRAGFEARFGRL